MLILRSVSYMAKDPEEKEELQEIPTEQEKTEKERKLLTAPDEIIALGLRELLRKDHPDQD